MCADSVCRLFVEQLGDIAQKNLWRLLAYLSCIGTFPSQYALIAPCAIHPCPVPQTLNQHSGQTGHPPGKGMRGAHRFYRRRQVLQPLGEADLVERLGAVVADALGNGAVELVHLTRSPHGQHALSDAHHFLHEPPSLWFDP